MTVHPTDDVAHNILNEQRGHVDRDPLIDCSECGIGRRWQDYWKPRIEDGRIENPRDDPWMCDTCRRQNARLKRRKRENRALENFA